MSERAPYSNPRLENFEANKKAYEAEVKATEEAEALARYQDELFGEAGTDGHYGAEDVRRLEEVDMYERHLKKIADRQEVQKKRELLGIQFAEEIDDSHVKPHNMDALHAEGLEMNAAVDAEEDARIAALMQSNPSVRQMQMIAEDIARIGAITDITPENDAKLQESLKDKQDRLEELLIKFSESDELPRADVDAITNRIIDMTEPVPVDARDDKTDDNNSDVDTPETESDEPGPESDDDSVEPLGVEGSPVDDSDVEPLGVEDPVVDSVEPLGVESHPVDNDVVPLGVESSAPEERSPKLDRLEAELSVARAEWAKISSKRQRRTFDRRIEGYNDVKTRYNTLVQERGRLMLADDLARAETATDKNALVIAYLAKEQNELRELVKHESDMKFPVKFANWMNRGSRKARLAKGVAIGLAAGAGGSLIAGAAGVGLLAGGAVAASRFVRGYTARHTDGMGKLDVEQASKDAAYRTRMYDGDEFENSAAIFEGYFESDSKKEQSKRRTAYAMGAVSVGIGAAAGNILHTLIDQTPSYSGANGQSGTEQQLVPTGGAGQELTPPVVSAPELHDLANAHDAYNVHGGEGWNETLKDMGVPKEKWAEVLKDAGPKLQDQKWAYFDSVNNEWRISHAGKLSESAIQALKDASARHGFSFR